MKFGIRSSIDVVFKTTSLFREASRLLAEKGMEWEKGEPVLYFDSLKILQQKVLQKRFTLKVEQVIPRLIAWEGDKTVTLHLKTLDFC